jgi:hypothetical protein
MSPRKMIFLAAAAATLWGTRAYSAILATDANAIAGFHGTRDFSTSIGTLSMKGEVDYAVYAPGQFKLTFNAAADPSNDTQYVYAYQMHNTGGTADRDLGFLSVGFDGQGGSNPGGMGFLNNNLGDDPSASTLIPTGGPPYNSATWNFASTIHDGQFSEILLFTSPFPPKFFTASVQGGGLSKESSPSPTGAPGGLPSPVPEPGVALVACGMIGALLIRRRNSK